MPRAMRGVAYRARVIAGATGAAVAAILVAGTFLLAPTNSGLTCGPCGAPPAWIESGAVSTGAGVNFYNFAILGGGQGDGADWNSVTLRLMNGSVPISTTAEGWNLTAYGADTALVSLALVNWPDLAPDFSPLPYKPLPPPIAD